MTHTLMQGLLFTVLSLTGIGQVNVKTDVRAKHLPALVFSSPGTGAELFRLQIGKAVFDPTEIDLDEIARPLVGFQILRFHNIPTPIIFAAAEERGGSDCSYAAAIAGVVDGKLAALTPNLPLVNYEGGYSFRSRGPGTLELIAWNFIWGRSESHTDPHDYWVQIYRWNGKRFVFARKYMVKKNEPDFNFDNFLLKLKGFGC